MIKYRKPLVMKHILQEIALPQFQRILIVDSKFLFREEISYFMIPA